jgi:predicted MPP superfamily phosphohydrolase
MPRTVTWLHLSDLHYCDPKTGWDSDRIIEALEEDLKRMQADHGLCPDLIFFTGDAAFGNVGNDEGRSIQGQFRAVAKLFDRFRKSFEPQVPKANFFLVPGNHDVDRTGIPDATWTWLDHLPRNAQGEQRISAAANDCDPDWKLCLQRLEHYKQFLLSFEYVHLMQDPERLIFARLLEINDVKIGIAGLNSAWSTGRDNEKSKLWLAGDWQIKQLKKQLKGADKTVVLMHHPPSWFNEAESAKVNTQIQATFDFFLHGHEHFEWVTPLATGHTRVAGGACYTRSRKETGYNFVHLDLDTGQGQVWLRRYEETGYGGWVPLVIPGMTNNDGRWDLLVNRSAPVARTRQPRADRVFGSTARGVPTGVGTPPDRQVVIGESKHDEQVIVDRLREDITLDHSDSAELPRQSILEDLEVVLHDQALVDAGYRIDLYFDACDVERAVLGMRAYFHDNPHDRMSRVNIALEEFGRPSALVACLLANGSLGPFQILAPHQAELRWRSNVSVNSALA